MYTVETDGQAQQQVDALPAVARSAYAELRVLLETSNIASAPGLNAFATAVAAGPLSALLLSVGLLNRALERHRFQAATFDSPRILP